MKGKRNYNNNRNKFRPKPHGGHENPKPTHVLPAPGILESYEELAPGAASIIVEMAKQEQEHRHNWENQYLKDMATLTKRGQLLGMALAIIIIYVSTLLAMDGNGLSAAIIAIAGFVFMGMASLAASNAKRHISRSSRRHGTSE